MRHIARLGADLRPETTRRAVEGIRQLAAEVTQPAAQPGCYLTLVRRRWHRLHAGTTNGLRYRVGQHSHQEANQTAGFNGRQVERLNAPATAPQAQIDQREVGMPSGSQTDSALVDREVTGGDGQLLDYVGIHVAQYRARV